MFTETFLIVRRQKQCKTPLVEEYAATEIKELLLMTLRITLS